MNIMGCFGYICNGCKTQIVGDFYEGGEKCIMIHLRHGVEQGRVEGHYDEYGRVIEQANMNDNERFCGYGNGKNSHERICESEFDLDDSGEESGIVAYHSCCYEKAEKQGTLCMDISEKDPKQSQGKIRKNFT